MMVPWFNSKGLARSAGPALALLTVSAVVVAGADGGGACDPDYTIRRCMFWADDRRLVAGGRDDSVTTLNLVKCRLKPSELEQTAFDGAVLPNLEKLLITYNRFEHLSPEIFVPVANVSILDLSHNKLREVPVCNALAPLLRLTYLHLGRNYIAEISGSSFSTCMKLRQLNLERNVIKSIHPEAFLQLTDLRELSLSNNYVTTIFHGMFSIRSLQSLHLDYNLIEYVSPSAFNGTKLTTLKLYRNRIAFLPAHFVTELNSAGGQVGELEFHDNPWYCACLLELLADVKRARVGNYSAHVYDRGAPVCLFLGRHACGRRAPSPLLPAPAPTSTASDN